MGKIEMLEAIPRKLVGDGKSPDVFFVSDTNGLLMISREFQVAYEYWKSLPRKSQALLEDRLVGVLASVETVDEESKCLIVRDDTDMLSKYHRGK